MSFKVAEGSKKESAEQIADSIIKVWDYQSLPILLNARMMESMPSKIKSIPIR